MLKNILTLFLTMVVYSGWGQSKSSSFSYVNIYGDTLVIVDFDKISSKLDTTFFKTNIIGLHFDTTLSQKTIRYTYFISDIKRTKKKTEFKFSLRITPHTSDIQEILKHLGGPSHYRMTLKKENGVTVIDKIEFINGEI